MAHSIQNSKSILAKALAQEDIRVEHSPLATTASFDVANRLLTLPIWENISDEMYDLLVGHEVGHALFTPDHDKETNKIDINRGPWIYEAERIGGNVNASYVQGILNIIEDVRIERKIKNKYPGLRRDFAIGYRQMLERDFFGTEGKDLGEFSFPDRINLYFKCGVQLNIPFTDDEMKIVNEIENCQSFDDTLRLTESVFNHINGKRVHVNMPEMKMDANAAGANPDGGNDEQNESQAQSFANATASDQDNKPANTQSFTSGSSESNEAKDLSVKNDLSNAPKGGSGLVNENVLPKMVTQSSFDKKNTESVNTKVDYVNYHILPVAISENIICPHTKVHSRIESRIADLSKTNCGTKLMTKIRNKYSKLISDTRPLIGSLVQQFEMKKAADIQKRTSISRSGKIDTDRIFKYRVSDDIFARYATIAEGKNHGMVMFIDWSASMHGCTEDVLVQVIMLSQFCRRMGIPFEVYLFSSQYTILLDKTNPSDPYSDRYTNDYKILRDKQWIIGKTRSIPRYGSAISSDKIFDINPDSFVLNQILSSSMSSKQFNDALFNTFCLGQFVSHPQDVMSDSRISVYPPENLGQGNTPLDNTIIAAMDIVPKFQAKHKVQIVNTIFLTDGETGWSPYYINSSYQNEISYVTSPINKKQYSLSQFQTCTDSLLNIFSDITGSTTIGFHLIPMNSRMNYCRYFAPDSPSSVDVKTAIKSFRDSGFYDAPKTRKTVVYSRGENKNIERSFFNHGYDRMFILPTQREDTESLDTIFSGIQENASFARVRNAFFKASEKRANSRGFINQFADVISVPTKR